MRGRTGKPLARFLNRFWNPVKRLPSLEDHLLDTTSLDIQHPGDIAALIRLLSEELSVEIELISSEHASGTHLESDFGASSTVAEMLYDPVSERVVVFVPTHIGEDHFLFFKSVLHEVSHLASGHPIPVLNGTEDIWWPPKRLASSLPVRDFERNEREADLRAEWSFMISLTGRDIHDTENRETAF